MEWKKNLSDYQAEPPATTWDQIATQLDQEAPASVQDALYQFESAPPAAVWAVVSGKLDQTASPTATVKKLWYRNPWNVAAAAVVAAVVFGISYTKDNSQASSGLATSVVSPLPASPQNGVTPENSVTADQDPLSTAMKNKDNNYLYFVSKTGETKRLSYKLQKYLPAIQENKPDKTLITWTKMLEHSAAAPAGGSFLDLIEAVKRMEEKKN